MVAGKLSHYDRGLAGLRLRGTGLGATGLFLTMYAGSMRASFRARAESSVAAQVRATAVIGGVRGRARAAVLLS